MKQLLSRAMPIRLMLAALMLGAFLQSAIAAPARIIILRHGEKENAWKLCEIGQQRAKALALNYLGRDAVKSLFAAGDEPAFFFAITLHKLGADSHAAGSWRS